MIRPSSAGASVPLADTSGAGAARIAASVSAAVGLANACRPVTISYSTAPSAKMSERASTPAPCTCSGAM